MVVINLLPWREQERAYHKRRLLYCLVLVFGVSSLIVSIIYSDIERKKHFASQHIEKLKVQIAQWAVKKTFVHLSTPLFSRDRAWHLVHYHADGLRIFAELGAKPAQHVCWTMVKRKGNKVIFSGRTDSAFDLTELLKNWNAAYLFSQIKLENLSEQRGAMGWDFKLIALPRTMLLSPHAERENADD